MLVLYKSYLDWTCCQLDFMGTFELCKIKMRKLSAKQKDYYVITYYDCKEVYSGTLAQCEKWMREHEVDRRYVNSGKD